jgi:hypothetical protein
MLFLLILITTCLLENKGLDPYSLYMDPLPDPDPAFPQKDTIERGKDNWLLKVL